jgi:CBS-domain-containing membrane protein
LGFFDISDVLSLIYGVDLLRHLFPVSKLREQTVDIHGLKLDLSYSRDAQGTDLPVSTMMQVDGHTAPWWPVSPQSSLLDVVKRLAAKVDPPWSSCRRVPVIDPSTGRVVKVISQSEMVSQIYHNVVEHKAAEPLFIETPRTHKIGLCEVMSVSATDSARKAFELIINHRVSAVPVIGPTGGMCAAITNKDIFLLHRLKEAQEAAHGGQKKKKGQSIPSPDEMPALEFVEAARKCAKDAGLKRQEPVTVTLDTPIHIIIKVLAEMKTHRVFIIDDINKPPVGVVSVSDIIKLILDEGLPWPMDVLVERVAKHTIS